MYNVCIFITLELQCNLLSLACLPNQVAEASKAQAAAMNGENSGSNMGHTAEERLNADKDVRYS